MAIRCCYSLLGQVFKLAAWGQPWDCAACQILLSLAVLGRACRRDGVMGQAGKLISRAIKVDVQGPCRQSGGRSRAGWAAVTVAVS